MGEETDALDRRPLTAASILPSRSVIEAAEVRKRPTDFEMEEAAEAAEARETNLAKFLEMEDAIETVELRPSRWARAL